jgi:hypothetical protein
VRFFVLFFELLKTRRCRPDADLEIFWGLNFWGGICFFSVTKWSYGVAWWSQDKGRGLGFGASRQKFVGKPEKQRQMFHLSVSMGLSAGSHSPFLCSKTFLTPLSYLTHYSFHS